MDIIVSLTDKDTMSENLYKATDGLQLPECFYSKLTLQAGKVMTLAELLMAITDTITEYAMPDSGEMLPVSAAILLSKIDEFIAAMTEQVFEADSTTATAKEGS